MSCCQITEHHAARFCYEQLTQNMVFSQRNLTAPLSRDGTEQMAHVKVTELCITDQSLFVIARIPLSDDHFAIFLLFTPPPTKLLRQPIIHLMLMTRHQLFCPSDIMPEDWRIDLVWLISAGMIQQHFMIYSTSNILRQDCPLGFDCRVAQCTFIGHSDPLSHAAASELSRCKSQWRSLHLLVTLIT